MKILDIRASARVNGSLSRKLADAFFAGVNNLGIKYELIKRDVGQKPPPIICEEWMAAAFSKDLKESINPILSESDELIEELKEADLILLSTPMYNYGMPAALKAWFDQVIRINKTFSFDLKRGDFPLEPMLKNKILVLLTSSGEFGFEAGGIRESASHLVPHIRTCCKYLGVDATNDFYHVGVEYQEFGDARHHESLQKAVAAVEKLSATLFKNKRFAHARL